MEKRKKGIKMSQYDYDLFVIGGGSGGIRAARWSAQLGAKVALCEESRLGGTCVIRGCIPKKLMVYASAFQKEFEIAKNYGWTVPPAQLDWEKMNVVRNKEIDRLEAIYGNILKNNNVKFLSGRGVLKDSHTVEVQGKLYTARYILIAVGGWPYKLPIEGSHLSITSNEIFSLKQKPKSLLVLGAGYIGLEFASIFNGFGTEVSVMFRKDLILSGFDQDVRKHLQEELTRKGIKMLPKRNPVKIEQKGESFFVTENQGGVWSGDIVLMATGRKANTNSLNLESLGIQTEKSQIVVDKKFQTNCENVFAIGDCTNQAYQLTPVALNEGIFISEYLFSKNRKSNFNYEAVPSAVFTQPEVGTVGLSEEQALEKGFQVEVYESRFRPLKLTLTKSLEKTYMKLIVCKKSDQLLGCHLVGEQAGEILQGFAVAVRNKLKKSDLDQTMGIHPSSAEEFVTMRTSRIHIKK